MLDVEQPFSFWLDELGFVVAMLPALTFNPFTMVQTALLGGLTTVSLVLGD